MIQREITNVMLIEDDVEDFIIVRNLLAQAGQGRFKLAWESQFDAAINTLAGNQKWDIYLVDYRLGTQSGVDFLMEGKRRGCKAPMILLTGHDQYDVDIEAMKAGAADYLPKNELTATLLERSIRYAMDRKQAETELRRARDGLAEQVRERTEKLELTVRALEKEVVRHKKTMENLDQKNTELRNFMDIVSHDLKNPLFAIRGFTGLLRNQFGQVLGGKGESHLSVIDSCARQMETLVTDLIRLSQVGHLSADIQEVASGEVMEQVLVALDNVLREKNVTVVPQNELPIVAFDPRRLYQVFENLMSNAVRFVPGDGTGRIDIVYRDQGDAYCFCVKDNGPGVAAKHQPKIFDRFYRVGSGNRGSGLGLTIVKEIVEQQGGSVWVESQEGQGATFCFTVKKSMMEHGKFA